MKQLDQQVLKKKQLRNNFNFYKILMLSMFYVFCFACKSADIRMNCAIKKIIKIESVLVSNSIDLRSPANSESKFDSFFFEEKKEKIIINTNSLKINLGNPLSNIKYVDIRTIVLLTKKDGSVEKLFIDSNGNVFYNDKVYKLSTKMMLFLRGGID